MKIQEETLKRDMSSLTTQEKNAGTTPCIRYGKCAMHREHEDIEDAENTL
jgi:hypothetical protein